MLRSSRGQLTMLLAVVALQNVAYTILIPLVPQLRAKFDMSVLAVGAAFGFFTAAKALAQPLGGRLSDSYQPRLVAVGGLLVAALATIALSLASSGGEVLVARLAWGLGEGLSMPALFVLMTDLGHSSGVGQARAIGWFGSSAVSGMALGPLMVIPLVGVVRFEGVFVVAGCLTALSAVLLRFVQPALRAPSATTGPAPQPERFEEPFAGSHRLVLGLGLVDMLNNLIYAGIEPVLPLVAAERLEAGARAVSIVLFGGLGVFAVAAPIAGTVLGRWRPLPVAVVVLSVQACCLCLPSIRQSALLYAGGFIALMAAQSFTYVCVRAALAGIDRKRRGRAFGSFGLVSDLGWVAGPLLTAALFGSLGTAVFLVLGLAAALALALAARLVVEEGRQTASLGDAR